MKLVSTWVSEFHSRPRVDAAFGVGDVVTGEAGWGARASWLCSGLTRLTCRYSLMRSFTDVVTA